MDSNSEPIRLQAPVVWWQIPIWATKNKYKIITLREAKSFEAYDPINNVIYYAKPEDSE